MNFSRCFRTCLGTLALSLAGCTHEAAISDPINSGTQFAVTGDASALYFDMQGILWSLSTNDGHAVAISDARDDLRLPHLSPDGQWLAAQSFAGGAWDIVLLGTDGRARRTLVASPYDDREPAWTPDGKHILFTSDRTGNEEIWSVDLATNTLTQLTDDPADDYAPAPTNEGFLFVSDRAGKTALYKQYAAAPPELLAAAPAGRIYAPRSSPNGQHIAWVQALRRNGFPGVAVNELVIYDTRTGTLQALSAEGSDVFGMAPTWLNNDTLVFAADGLIQRVNISSVESASIPFSARLPLPAMKQLADSMRPPIAFAQNEQPVLGIVDPVVLPDDSIVFTAMGDLWLLDINGDARQLTDDVFVERDLAVSPDGRQLTYISDRDGSMEIWLQDLATGDARRASERAGGPRYPTFAPDGSRLAYQQAGPIGTQDFTVRVLDMSTGKSLKLRSSPKIWPGRMSWSADGKHVTVAALTMASGRATDGRNQLVRIDVANDKAMTMALPDNATPDFGPVASRDGRQLALVIDGSLWRVPVSADGRIAGAPVQTLNELVESPAWSWDGQRLTALTNCGLQTFAVYSGERSCHNPELSWQPAAANGRQIIHAGRLWDGSSDEYQYNIDVVVDNAGIAAVRPHTAHAAGTPVIDASEQTVLPGLIDHHVHFEAHKGEWVGRSLLAFGLTTVVEPGGLPYESREHMESWLSGKRIGPRLVFAGPQLDGYRRTFYFAAHINSEDRLRQELERGDRLGYGLLKTYRRMRPALQAKTVQLGHERGLPVTAHAGLRNIGFGGDRTEHLRGSSRTGSSPKQSDLLLSYDDILAIYTVPQASVTPTLINQGGFFNFALSFAADGDGLEGIRQYTALYPPAYRNNLAAFTGIVSKNMDLIRTGLGNAGVTLKHLDAANVTIVAGTDSPIFPYGLALIIELQTYVDAGLSPVAALRTATTNAAKALGADNHIGRIEPGRLADIIIVDGDPLTNVTDLLQVTGVMLNGRYRTLDELL